MADDIILQGDDGTSTIVLEATTDESPISLEAGGLAGPPGVGVPSGGSIGQFLAKRSGTPYDTYWKDLTAVDAGLPYFDVTAPPFNALGDGSGDDQAAIKAAADTALFRGGGIVWMPAGTYAKSGTLPLYSKVSYRGAGIDSTFMIQTDATVDAFYGEDVSSMSLIDFVLEGQGTDDGRGIVFAKVSAQNTPYIRAESVWVRNFGGDGIVIDTPIVTTLEGVISADNAGKGFNIQHGTSVNFAACFANNNDQAGYYLDTVQYSGFYSCASDSNGIGYDLIGCQGITFDPCGAEVILARDATWDGTSIKLDGCYTIKVHAWIYQNNAVGIWVTGGSQNIEIFATHDNSPAAGATNFVKVDSGCIVTVSDVRNVTANSYAAGTTTVLNDGAGNMVVPHALNVGTDFTVGGIAFMGTMNVYGDINMQSGTHVNLDGNPASALQAAPKQYVDAAASSSKAFAVAMAAAL